MWIWNKRKRCICFYFHAQHFPFIPFCKRLCASICQKHMFVCNVLHFYSQIYTGSMHLSKIYGCFLKYIIWDKNDEHQQAVFYYSPYCNRFHTGWKCWIFYPKINQWQMSSMYLKYLNKKMQNKSYSGKNRDSVPLFQINPTFSAHGSWTLINVGDRGLCRVVYFPKFYMAKMKKQNKKHQESWFIYVENHAFTLWANKVLK